MSKPAESLPEIQDAVLDADTLDALFKDLAGLVEIHQIILKGASRSRAQEGSVSLEEARAALQRAEVIGVQIRYRYQGNPWWDTLLRTPHGIRLVRIQTPAC